MCSKCTTIILQEGKETNLYSRLLFNSYLQFRLNRLKINKNIYSLVLLSLFRNKTELKRPCRQSYNSWITSLSKSSWMGLWAKYRGRFPCSHQMGWNQITLRVPSNWNHSMISACDFISFIIDILKKTIFSDY